MGTLKWKICVSVFLFFDDVVVVTAFEPLSFERLFVLHQFCNSLLPIPGERDNAFSCDSTVYFYIVHNNKVTGTVIAFSGYKSVAYVFSASQLKLFVVKGHISLFRIPVCSNYSVIWTINSFLKPTLIPIFSVMKGLIILVICAKSVHNYLTKSCAGVGVKDFTPLANFFSILPRDFFGTYFVVLASVPIVIDNWTVTQVLT